MKLMATQELRGLPRHSNSPSQIRLIWRGINYKVDVEVRPTWAECRLEISNLHFLQRERERERELLEKEIGVKGYRVVPPPPMLNAVFIRKQHPVHFLRDKNIKRDLVAFMRMFPTCFSNFYYLRK